MTPSISFTAPNPNRALLQGGQYVDVTNDPRPPNRNPQGVSFSDCEEDLKLTFPVSVSGFDGSSGFEVWAGTTDCTAGTARGIGQVPTCWRVGPVATSIVDPGPTTVSVDVYARDVLRYENATPPQVPAYDPTFHDGPQGESACHVQTTDAQVTINLYFVPIQLSANVGMPTGTASQYPLVTDLLGPPPPTNLQLSAGNGLLGATWSSPGNDPDVAGFALWTDPPPGAPAPAAPDAGAGDAGAASCTSDALTSHTIVDEPAGGISQIPQANAAGEIDGASATSFQLTGLTGGAPYAVAVTSVDGSGNFGPPATPACATPSADPGQVGGFACSLVGPGRSREAPAAAVATGIVMVVLRRRRLRRTRSRSA